MYTAFLLKESKNCLVKIQQEWNRRVKMWWNNTESKFCMDKGKNVSMEVFHLVSLKFAGAGDVAKNFNDVSDLSLNVSIATGSVYSQNR